MDIVIHQIANGLATGAIYAILALALVMNFNATGHINFAQGEMAMFSTYIAWSLSHAGLPFWAAFLIAVGISFMAGMVLQRCLLFPFRNAQPLSLVVVFIALFLGFNAMAGWIWGFVLKEFPSPVKGWSSGTSLVGAHELFVAAVTLGVLALLYLLFRFTRLGLAMRAVSVNLTSSALVGIHVSRILTVGWGMAAAIGAVAGMLIAPITFLDPNMMLGILLYAFAAALLGGIDSPPGAVIGGLIVGVLENLLGAYVVGPQLKLTGALAIVVLVLVLRPRGLLGRRVVRRV